MNREIKFRVWDNVNYMSIPFTLEDVLLTKTLFDSDCPVMQFTGLKDMKGNDIFEGDIVRVLYTDWPSQHLYNDGRENLTLEKYKESISKVGEVVFDHNMWKYHFMESGIRTLGSTIHGRHGQCEIIGNIYENKELLK